MRMDQRRKIYADQLFLFESEEQVGHQWPVLFQLTETEMSVNWNRSNPLTITETEIHAKTVIKRETEIVVTEMNR